MFFAYLFSVRERDQDYLFQMGRLFQELIIFGRITIDNSRLMWQLTHQQEMRAEKFCSLHPALCPLPPPPSKHPKGRLGPLVGHVTFF